MDPVRGQVFSGSGNVYTILESAQACQNKTANKTGFQHDSCTPDDVYPEAILAFDLEAVFQNWYTRPSALDAWTTACVDNLLDPQNCPPQPGTNIDFGLAPNFVPGPENTPYGEDSRCRSQKRQSIRVHRAS